MPSSPAHQKSKHKEKASRQNPKQSFDHFKTTDECIGPTPILKEANPDTASVGNVQPPQTPQTWPVTIPYLQRPVLSLHLTEHQQRWLRQKPPITSIYSEHNSDVAVCAEVAVPVIKLPALDIADKIEIRLIQDTAHPAFGQHGLFAVRDLSPGSFVLHYMGYVHSSSESERTEFERRKLKREIGDTPENCSGGCDEDSVRQQIGSWDKSDYDLNLYREEEIELAIDAALMGNEARFCNDYRGVPAFVDSAATAKEKSWNRKAKRAAKTQVFAGDLSSANAQSQTWTDHHVAIAIPNAEFRDVWFEWSTNDSEVCKDEGDQNMKVDSGTRTVDEAMKQLRVNDTTGSRCNRNPTEVETGPEICQSRSGRRRRKDKTGMRGVAIFVLPAGRSGKRKSGIRAGQEVLVSYGKGFWAHHTN